MTNHPPKAANASNRITKMAFTNKRGSFDRVGLAEVTQLSGRFPSCGPAFADDASSVTAYGRMLGRKT